MRRLVAVGALLIAASAAPVAAAPIQEPTTLYLDQRYTADPVDRQTWCGDCPFTDYTQGSPWTVNPGWLPGYTPTILREATGAGSQRDRGCMWDSDDWFEYRTQGNIFDPNTTFVATECRWRQINPHTSGGDLFYLSFQSASPDLVMDVTWDWGAGSVTYTYPPPIATQGKLWVYGGATQFGGRGTCLWPPTAHGGVEFPIPDSHDGVAFWEEITVTISNPTGRKAGKSGGFFGTDYRDNGLYCDWPDGVIFL